MDSRLESALVASESSEREHVVDWGTGLFHASGSRLAEATFSDDLLVLCVQGICHSTITKASIKWSSRGIHDDIEAYFEFRNLVGKDFQQSYTNEEEEEDDEVEDDEEGESIWAVTLAMTAGVRVGGEVVNQDVLAFVPGKARLVMKELGILTLL